jgi:two-component system, NtrC family, nitrogen regulation response regulator GlnG
MLSKPSGRLGTDSRPIALVRQEDDKSRSTTQVIETVRQSDPPKPALRVRVVTGAMAGREVPLLPGESITVGSGEEADLRLPDPSVSRRHLEITLNGPFSAEVRDLGSTNGSYCEGNQFSKMTIGPGTHLSIGQTNLQMVADVAKSVLPLSNRTEFGGLLGQSRRMRELFTLLERASKSQATVLITGETGTGKEMAARAIHESSDRSGHPWVVVDCASIPQNLIESELFGHVKGAFTGATQDRKGSFVSADGGSIFLDELAELPESLQPRLLRVLETRKVKPVGTNVEVPVNVRVIAATNRPLEEDVRSGRFRSDLYFRLAVIRVHLPPLRERREDIELLAEDFLRRTGDDNVTLSPGLLAALKSHKWPGNVRELRNVIEQSRSLSPEDLSLAQQLRSNMPSDQKDAFCFPEDCLAQPYKEARQQVIEAFERQYAESVVARANGSVRDAADLAGVHRNVLHRILGNKKPGTQAKGPK